MCERERERKREREKERERERERERPLNARLKQTILRFQTAASKTFLSH